MSGVDCSVLFGSASFWERADDAINLSEYRDRKANSRDNRISALGVLRETKRMLAAYSDIHEVKELLAKIDDTCSLIGMGV